MAASRLGCRPRALRFAAAILLVSTAGGLPTAFGADKGPPESEIDLKTSRVFIRVGKVGLGHEHAVVGEVKSGSLQRGNKSGAGEIVIDMTSFDADTAEARKYIGLKGTISESTQAEVTSTMLGTDILDVEKFPTATFRIGSALLLPEKSEEGRPQYRLEGDFTLHGVKRPLKLDAEEIKDESGVRLHGVFTIRQTDFGIARYSKAFGTIGVADELTVHGEIHLRKPTPPEPKSKRS